MKNPMVALARAAVLTAAAAAAVHGVEPSADTADPCLWLEERSDEASLEWVRSHVGATMDELRADRRADSDPDGAGRRLRTR